MKTNKLDKLAQNKSKYEVWNFDETVDDYYLISVCDSAEDTLTLARTYDDPIIVKVIENRTLIKLGRPQ